MDSSTRRFKVGDLEVTSVLEAEIPVPRDLLAIGSDPDALLATCPWAQPALATPDGRVYFALAAICVAARGRRILIDPCISFDARRAQPDAAEQAEALLARLAAIGFGPSDVDVVVSTHVDGIGWSTRPADGGFAPTFPKARYLWTAIEIERVLAEAGPDAESLAPLLDAGLVDRVVAPCAISDEVSLEPAAGHAPGNVNVWIRSGGESAVVVGDMILHPLQVAEPDWGGLDANAEQAAEARRSVLDRAARDGALVIGPHFPAPGAFRVTADGDAWRPLDVPDVAPPSARA
jgi:glyoxylase-like metal-dependent hydrolase (beta-lactamase superfamily II)